MSECVIDQEGDEPTDWRLVVTGGGDVVARREVPFDGVLRFSTETRRSRPQKNSEFGLDARAVINRYLSQSTTATPRHELVDDVQAALAE